MSSIKGKIGCSGGTLRNWVRQAERDRGQDRVPSRGVADEATTMPGWPGVRLVLARTTLTETTLVTTPGTASRRVAEGLRAGSSVKFHWSCGHLRSGRK